MNPYQQFKWIDSGENIELNANRYHRFDGLKFYKINSSLFPSLVPVVKMILSIPATSVPSETLFSHAGTVQAQLRNR